MQAEAVRNYKPCDELSEQMSELKAHKREKGKEHVILRKENRSPKNVAKVRSTAPALSVTTPPGANTSSVSSRSSLNPDLYSSVSAYFGGSSSESVGTCFSESDVMIVEPPPQSVLEVLLLLGNQIHLTVMYSPLTQTRV